MLSVAAWIQDDYSNSDEYQWNNAFQQLVLRDATFSGMYSLWYTNPVSFASGDYGFQGTVGYSSFFHEMGHNFTLNDPATPQDETFDTFMTIAYQFCANAEKYGTGYRAPLKRMMALLEKFNPEWQVSYDPSHATAQADTFRATLMTAAMSYGFNMDLREVFRNLNFPISDDIYNSLMARMTQ